jgi:hypothetical protein
VSLTSPEFDATIHLLFAENQPRNAIGIDMNKTAFQLHERILSLVARGVGQPTTDAEFDALAREIFTFQYDHCGVYRAFCEQQRFTPETVEHWKQIPAVPTTAFKHFALACFPVEEAAAEFHTSGTTREKSGKHFFQTLDLYEAAIRPNFEAHLLPEIVERASRPFVSRHTLMNGQDARSTLLPMLVLTPSPEEAPHSSLAHMMGVVVKEFGTTDSGFYVERGAVCMERLTTALREAERARQPVFLLGTAFAFVQFFDSCAAKDLRFELAAGSRAMETGGFKGRTREVPKKELYGMFERVLGIPSSRVVNEYGMTELSTQFYDLTLRDGRQTDQKIALPWSRVLVIDPDTGKEQREGERGLIRIHDLSNLWSAMCIQTEDLGIATGDRFEVLGRAAGAEVRGCSLNAETFSAR